MRAVLFVTLSACIAFAAAFDDFGRDILMVRTSGEKHPAAQLLRDDVRSLTRELDRIERFLGQGAPGARRSLDAPRDVAAELERLEERVAALEAAWQQGRPAFLSPVRLAQMQMEREEPQPQDILFTMQHLEARILDENHSPEDRIAALEHLNHLPIPDARGRDIVDAMLALLPQLRDEDLKRDLINHLSGVDDPRYRDILLDLAFFDASRHVRGAAARKLRTFRDEESVGRALEWIAISDTDQGVRAGARRALERD